MPFTFLAHQAPFLSVARKHRTRIDPVTLLVGTMAPDFAYVLNDTRFHLWAHDLPWLVTFCVPVTLAVSWLVVRVVAPVVPDQLPPRGGFAFADYRAVAGHRFGLVRSPSSALAGAVTHVLLDHLTHAWGWPARHVAWYRRPIMSPRYLGKVWAPFEIMQFLGHVGLSALALVVLWRWGRSSWLAGAARRVQPYPVSARSRSVFFAVVAVGALLSVGWVVAHPHEESGDVMRAAAGVFAAIVVGALLLRGLPEWRRRGPFGQRAAT